VRAKRDPTRLTASLDESAGERARPLSEVIGDPHGSEPEDGIARDEMRREVWQLLRLLPERHRHVLIRRRGIGGGRPESQREIGHRLGEEERSRLLEREAQRRLRELPISRQRVPFESMASRRQVSGEPQCPLIRASYRSRRDRI
jgi:DNA-directed RNA polymerase sigma subunit (sigma70/sigma32)